MCGIADICADIAIIRTLITMSIEVRLAGGMVNNSEDRYVALGDLYIVSDMLRSNSGGANNKPKHVNTPAGHRNVSVTRLMQRVRHTDRA